MPTVNSPKEHNQNLLAAPLQINDEQRLIGEDSLTSPIEARGYGTTVVNVVASAPSFASRNADEPPREEEESLSPPSCCSKVRHWFKKWRPLLLVIVCWFLTGTSNSILSPILPEIKRDYFGSDQKAAMADSIMGATSAIAGMIIAPLIGQFMDSWGRRPFIITSAVVSLASKIVLLVAIEKPLYTMIVQAVAQAIGQSGYRVFLADHYTAKVRAQAFAALYASGNLTSVFSMLVFGMSNYALAALSVGLTAVVLIICLVLPESLSKMHRKPMMCSTIENPFRAMKHVVNSKIMIAAVALMGIFSVSQSGVVEVYFYFLNQRVGFTRHDNALVLLEAGILFPFFMVVMIPLLTRVAKLRQATVLLIADVALLFEMTVMCLLFEKWQVYAFGLPLAGAVGMCSPILAAIVANGSDGTDQGRRQAGFSAFSDLFGALAPLFFGQTYSRLHGNWVILPFVISGIATIPAFYLTWKLRIWIIKGEENITDDEADDSSSIESPATCSDFADADDQAQQTQPIMIPAYSKDSSSSTIHIRP